MFADQFEDVTGGIDIVPEEEYQGTPLEQLTRHWMNERHAPDILAAQEDLLTNLLDHLRRQVRLKRLFFQYDKLKESYTHKCIRSWSVRSRAVTSRRPFYVGGRTYAHYVGSNRNRAGQVCRKILCAYTTLQGMLRFNSYYRY